jgi:hypothetical protein
MEVQKIEQLIEQFLEGNTTLQEEKMLKDYFTKNEVPSHLSQYQSLFGYYKMTKSEMSKDFEFPVKKQNYTKWFGVAASVAFVTVLTFFYLQNNTPKQENLGTFDSPEEAFVETHKALQLVANNINSGMENVSYLEEYEKTKKTIFK